MIRSFVRRSGRITLAQQRALDTLWPQYGVTADGILNFTELFGRNVPTYLEIGFGNGEALLTMAQRHPEFNYLGIEVHSPGVGHLLLQLSAQQLPNIRISDADAVVILQHHLPPHSLAGIHIFFPDPWPKQRHHKRRLIQPAVVKLLATVMQINGYLHLATDWPDYAQQMLQILDTTPEFINHSGLGCFTPRPPQRPLTKFEQRGHRLGHQVWDLVYRRLEI